jgi:hypothetical protein
VAAVKLLLHPANKLPQLLAVIGCADIKRTQPHPQILISKILEFIRVPRILFSAISFLVNYTLSAV